MNDITIILLACAVLIIGFLVWLYFNDYFNKLNWWKASILKSLIYSFFLGIGFLGEGGGDPGFVLPYPVGASAILYLTESNFRAIVENALVPYIFWIAFLFIMYCLKHIIKVMITKLKKIN